jgi:hypothetical protein
VIWSFELNKEVKVANLYVFHQGSGNDQQLWYSVFDGTSWRGETQVPNLGMSESPSAVAWKGGISVFHQGSDNDGQLWYAYSGDGYNWGTTQTDTQVPVPNLQMSGSPSVVEYNGLLYVFFQGGDPIRGTALVRDLRWDKLGRVRDSQPGYVGLTLGSTLEGWYCCLPPGER